MYKEGRAAIMGCLVHVRAKLFNKAPQQTYRLSICVAMCNGVYPSLADAWLMSAPTSLNYEAQRHRFLPNLRCHIMYKGVPPSFPALLMCAPSSLINHVSH
jgi:hypothetical protein